MKKLCLITILLASAFLFTLEASATKYYVNDISLTNDIYTTAIGNNSNSGTSPNAPKLTLGAAITAASADDTIYVDAGTYTGTGNISLNITKTLTIIGAGTGNTIFTSHTNNRFVRIQALNVTISNMQIYDFFLEGHGQAIMVDANKTGFTLTNIVMKRNLGAGNAGGSSIYLSSGSSTTINSILFSCSGFNGSYGGAIKVDNATLVMNKSVFFQARDNDGLGGAIGISGASSNIKIYNSVFKQCNSRAGGAISQTGGTLLVSGSCFMDNFIQGDASSNTNGGGHYYSTGTIVSAKFSNCSFTGAFFCSSTNPPSGSICEFSSNTSNDGKAISLRTVSGNFTFDTCYFDNSNISTSFDLGLDLYLKGGASCFVNINSCKFGNDQMPSNANKSNIYNADLPSANLIVTASGAAQTTQNQDGTDGNNFSYKGNAPGGTSNNNLPTTDPITSCTNVTIAGCDNISINCATENNPPVIISCATDKTITDCSALGDYRSEVAAFDDCSLTVSQNPPPGTQLNDGAHTVTLTVTDEAGNSTACNITVTVSGCGCTPPAPPTGTSTQNFCAIDSATVGDLQANGSNIQWYNAPTGGTLYLSTDALVNNSTYYATQTVSGCESTTRLAVVVTISNPSAPTGTSAQNFCAIDSGTVADLFAIGSNLQWYAAPTGGTPYLNTTPLVNGLTYYATQTVGSCESETRMPVSVLISNPAAPTGTSAQNFCALDSATVADLVANGNNVQWYAAPTGGTPYLNTTALVNGLTYYATQTLGSCESETRMPVSVLISNPAAPTGTSAQNFCAIDSATVADLAANGNNVQWYAAPTGGTPYLNTTVLVNGLTYYATQTLGSCESETRMPVSVLISNPAAPTGTSAQNFCAIDSATVADLVANGNNVQWYAAPTGGTPYLNTTALVNGLTYYATQTVGSCKSVNRLSVSVTIIQNPILNLTAPSVCSGTNALITASAAPPDVYTYLWNVPTDMGNPGNISSFTTSVAGNYSVTVTDTHGCSSSETDTLVFYSNPVINNVIQDATCPGSNDGMITLAVSGGTEPYDYTWSNGTSNAQLIGISGGTYTISVSDYNNCSVSDTLTVNITSEDCLNIPTAFSPNGDGINDTWEIEHIDLYDEIVIEIYNRWGQLIFSYSGPGKGYADLSNRWDGTFKGKVLPVSSFIFTLDLKDGNKPTQGIVSIIK